VCGSGRRICIRPRNYYATRPERQIAEGKSLSLYTHDASRVCIYYMNLRIVLTRGRAHTHMHLHPPPPTTCVYIYTYIQNIYYTRRKDVSTFRFARSPPTPRVPRGIAAADLDRSVKYAYTQHINIVAIAPPSICIYVDTKTVRAPRYRPSACILHCTHTHTHVFINNKCVSLSLSLTPSF